MCNLLAIGLAQSGRASPLIGVSREFESRIQSLRRESMERLKALLKGADKYKGKPWVVGRIPEHYKRCTATMEERIELALLGQQKLFDDFGCTLYFDQALIAGAILSDRFDQIVIVTPSQFGKSWTLARVAMVNASKGRGSYIAGANEDTTRIIMQKLIESLKDASDELKDAMLTDGLDRLEKLGVSLSKKNIALRNGGFIEPITLGASFGGLAYNKAVGRSADFFVDEAALVPTENFTELGRREFANVDGTSDKMIMISNPHQPGFFYDHLTEENPGERTFILWMDVRTAVEERRWTTQQVLESEFAKHADTRTRYLLCELPQAGMGMFGEAKVGAEPTGNRLHFLGIDAAYKGKDNIEVCHVSVGRNGLYVHEIATIIKKDWVDGVTSSDITNTIGRLYRATGSLFCCVDIGFGVWLTEGLAHSGYNVQGINFASKATPERVKAKHYAAVNAQNKRAEMHLDLQNLIETKGIEFSEESYEKIRETLPYVSMERKSGGRILIKPKADIKAIIGKSPDALDSALLAIHAAILYTGEVSDYMTE